MDPIVQESGVLIDLRCSLLTSRTTCSILRVSGRGGTVVDALNPESIQI
jgi:hypothetical protein